MTLRLMVQSTKSRQECFLEGLDPVYIALSIGQPQRLTHGNISSEGRPIDMYFISVAGGLDHLKYKPFCFNRCRRPIRQVLWSTLVNLGNLIRSCRMYTSGALGGQMETYFLKKIKTPYGQTLDIIALDTVLFQDPSKVRADNQILWLTRILKESDSDWKIAVGFHQLITSDYNIWKMEEKTSLESLHGILLQYGVDAYISMKTCSHIQEGTMGLSMNKGPYLTATNQNLIFKEETVNGFLLHQLSSLEMDTFAVKLTGEVEHKLSLQQRGRAVM
ncbi:hypothetical protein DH2020_010849 [Rehmannia glutinosa]|uniref:Uncharacterized protein n=1 Tax=Rehmannia glutinosa TaxID=99300 RepID=A0ABR0XCE9_REHGL